MELEQIEGTVEDIIYENPDNGYTVFEISGGGTVTVVCGIVGELHAGESVVCRGKYENHATYGRQFHAQECETDMPKDLEAVYAFLASGSLPYIGARTANKIIDKFGAAALEVIANDPAQLTLIPGISADKADRIQQEFKRMFGMRELIAYLAQFEISPRRAMEVFRVFGPSAMQAISQNPYLLCGEPLQLDFRHADSIAQYYHMEGDCTQRLEAALLRTLRHNAGNGHTCLPRAQLLDTASHFIQQPPEKLARALDHCIETGQLGVKMLEAVPYIYLPDLLEAEQAIADRLALLAKREKQTVRDLDKNIQVLELTQGFAYAPLQREAIRKAMTENCLVLTGGPGTGKTTTVNAILQLLEHQADRVALCAPTGRAAKRLSELTGRKASTIHRLLEVDYSGGVVSFIHNDKNLLKCDVVILDEMSMVDVKLFQEMGKEFLRLYKDCGVTKILTIEASGIGIACVAAQFFDCPVIFAKKNKTKNIAGDVYTSKVESFTHGKVYDIIVSKQFLLPEDRVLIIDDFLANGSALQGLIKLVRDAGATLVGAGIAVEKAFQPGGDLIRGMGVHVESLARIKSMSVEDGVEFC